MNDTDQKAARERYEANLERLFRDASDAELLAEADDHIAWRDWYSADLIYDELERRARADG